MKKLYNIEDSPTDLTERQKTRWIALKNKTAAFLMWRLRMTRANKNFTEMDYVKHGYDI